MNIVAGNGWAALASIGYFVARQEAVTWIIGDHVRLSPPIDALPWQEGALNPGSLWNALAVQLGLTDVAFEVTLPLREYRNKAFRHPLWKQNPAHEAQLLRELLWAPETQFVGLTLGCYPLPLIDILEGIEAACLASPYVQRLENATIKSLVPQTATAQITLGLTTGQQLQATRLIYADAWGDISTLEGIARPIPEAFRQEMFGVLQLKCTHSIALPTENWSMFTDLARDPHQAFDRRVWGYFLPHRKESIWSMVLTPEELALNYEIAKKVKKMRTSIDKMFSSADFIPEDKHLSDTITQQQLRFEPQGFFGTPTCPGPLYMGERVTFITDGFGPTEAILQAHRIFTDIFPES